MSLIVSSRLRLKYLLPLSDFKKLEFSWQIFKKICKYKKLTPSSRSWGVLCRRADRWTDVHDTICHDMTKLLVPFRTFANAPKSRYTIDLNIGLIHTPLWITGVCWWRHEEETVAYRLRSLNGASCWKAASWLACQGILFLLLKLYS